MRRCALDDPNLHRLPAAAPAHDRAAVLAARTLLPAVRAGGDIVEALCAAALALGVDALRASSQALRVACAAAALDGRHEVSPADAALAAQLVRATRLPAPPPADEQEDGSAEPEAESAQPETADAPPSDDNPSEPLPPTETGNQFPVCRL